MIRNWPTDFIKLVANTICYGNTSVCVRIHHDGPLRRGAERWRCDFCLSGGESSKCCCLGGCCWISSQKARMWTSRFSPLRYCSHCSNSLKRVFEVSLPRCTKGLSQAKGRVTLQIQSSGSRFAETPRACIFLALPRFGLYERGIQGCILQTKVAFLRKAMIA